MKMPKHNRKSLMKALSIIEELAYDGCKGTSDAENEVRMSTDMLQNFIEQSFNGKNVRSNNK